jgi:hypothetical protein
MSVVVARTPQLATGITVERMNTGTSTVCTDWKIYIIGCHSRYYGIVKVNVKSGDTFCYSSNAFIFEAMANAFVDKVSTFVYNIR